MLERTPPQFRELQEISMQTDTRDILAHATRQSESYEDYFLVDIDAHVTETSFWPEILALIDNEVIRQMGQAIAGRPGSGNVALLNSQPGILYQHVYGRIPHQQALLEKVEKKGTHHFVELARRSMDAAISSALASSSSRCLPATAHSTVRLRRTLSQLSSARNLAASTTI